MVVFSNLPRNFGFWNDMFVNDGYPDPRVIQDRTLTEFDDSHIAIAS